MPLYDDLPGPEAGTANFAATIGTTHAVYAIPAAWLDRRVDVCVRAPGLNSSGQPASVWVLFGSSASMEVSRTAVVSGTPPAWTGAATIGRPIRDGESRDYKIRSSWTHFAIEADLAACEVYITPSDYPKHETQAG